MKNKVNKIVEAVIAITVIASGMVVKSNADSYVYYNCLPTECVDDGKVDYSHNIDIDLQRYINNLCRNNKYISPELLYAIMSYESGYDKQHIVANKYYGLMQIDKSYFRSLADRTGMEINEKTILYTYTNVRCGYELLNLCIEYFRERGYAEDELLYIAVSAYGRGIGYTEECLKNNESKCLYADNVIAMYDYIMNYQEAFVMK